MGSGDIIKDVAKVGAGLATGGLYTAYDYNKQQKSKSKSKASANAAGQSSAANANIAAAEKSKRLQNLQYGDSTSGLGGNSGIATTPFRTLLGK